MMPYEQVRQAYWNAQTELRLACIEEMWRILPAIVDRVNFEINDTLRLAVVDLLDSEGVSVVDWAMELVAGDDLLFDAVDQIAFDADVHEYEEALTFLSSDDRGVLYIVRGDS